MVGQDGSEVVRVDFAKRIPAAKSVLVGFGRFSPQTESRQSQFDGNESLNFPSGLPRPLTEDDQLRFSAEQAMGAGEAILRNFQTNYLDDSLAKYQAALELWKRIGRPAPPGRRLQSYRLRAPLPGKNESGDRCLPASARSFKGGTR